jgi:hypothetical protein
MNQSKNTGEGGAMCGGVINETLFQSDPMAYMMAYVMPDDKFKEYQHAKESGDDKSAKELFNEYSRSVI